MEDVERNVFGNSVKRFGVGRAFDLNGFATVEFMFWLGLFSVDADLTVFDEELYARSRDVRKSLGEILVEAEIGGGRVCGKGSDAIFVVVVEFEDGYWNRRRFFDAAGGAVFGFNSAATLALGEHVLRRHG